MKVLDKEKSNLLVEFVLRSKEGLSVEKPEEKRIDFIVRTETETYAVFTRYRNFPLQETKSRTLQTEEEERIEDICNDKYIPLIAYVFYEEKTEKIYIFLMTLDRMHELADSDYEFLNNVLHGVDIKFGIGKEFNDTLFDGLKRQVCTTEISFEETDNPF